MMGLGWIVTGAICPEVETNAPSGAVRIDQATTMEINGHSAGLVQVLREESTVTGKPFFLARLAVFDRNTKTEKSLLLGHGNEFAIGSQRVRIDQIQPAPSADEPGFVLLHLLP